MSFPNGAKGPRAIFMPWPDVAVTAKAVEAADGG